MKKAFLIFTNLFILLFSHYLFAQFDNKQVDIIDVFHYSFHIEIADGTDIIKAKTIISFQLRKKTDSIYFNFKNKNTSGKGMFIHSIVNSKGIDIEFKHKDDNIIIYNTNNWKIKEHLIISIVYSGIPIDGLYIGKSIYGKKTFFGDNWPNRAHYWLPVIDHPSDKAKVDFFIIAPNHFKVVASGILRSKEDLDTNKKKYHYQTNKELATKVMVFGAADFKIKELDTINNIPVSSWIYKEAPDEGFDDYKDAVKIVSFYDSLIAPYPYKKLANVQSKTRFGGMENAGNIFYYEKSINGMHQVEPLIAHEVAHQWFGNSVSEKKWEDIWLSEGFATYLTDVYLEFKYGKEKLKERMQMERIKVINYVRRKDVQPIVYEEKENLFKLLNRNSYEKGAWVLHMLRIRIGDENFFKTLRSFYLKYQDKNASTKDFIKIAEEESNQKLKSFFNQWLYRNDIPIIKLDWKIVDTKLIIDVEQNQIPYILALPIMIINKNNEQLFNLNLNKEKQSFEFDLIKGLKDGKLIVDPDIQVLFQLD